MYFFVPLVWGCFPGFINFKTTSHSYIPDNSCASNLMVAAPLKFGMEELNWPSQSLLTVYHDREQQQWTRSAVNQIMHVQEDRRIHQENHSWTCNILTSCLWLRPWTVHIKEHSSTTTTNTLEIIISVYNDFFWDLKSECDFVIIFSPSHVYLTWFRFKCCWTSVASFCAHSNMLEVNTYLPQSFSLQDVACSSSTIRTWFIKYVKQQWCGGGALRGWRNLSRGEQLLSPGGWLSEAVSLTCSLEFWLKLWTEMSFSKRWHLRWNNKTAHL